MSQRQLSPASPAPIRQRAIAPTKAVGRPTKFTPEVRGKLLDAIRKGLPISTACGLAAIDYDTFRLWMRCGEAGEPPFLEFFNEIELAQAQAEDVVTGHWRNAFPNDWKAARDYAARRWPDHWADQSKRTVTIEGQQPIQINVLSINDVDGLAGLLGAGELVDVDPVEDDPNDNLDGDLDSN